MKLLLLVPILLLVSLTPINATTIKPDIIVPMTKHGAATYYVKADIHGLGQVDLMVDTGSGFSTINEHSLSILKQKGMVRYKKDLVGILANGNKMKVAVYTIASMNIGENCLLKDIDAAVFPGKTRQILGLSALRKTAPFMFSVQPPELTLTQCDNKLNT